MIVDNRLARVNSGQNIDVPINRSQTGNPGCNPVIACPVVRPSASYGICAVIFGSPIIKRTVVRPPCGIATMANLGSATMTTASEEIHGSRCDHIDVSAIKFIPPRTVFRSQTTQSENIIIISDSIRTITRIELLPPPTASTRTVEVVCVGNKSRRCRIRAGIIYTGIAEVMVQNSK